MTNAEDLWDDLNNLFTVVFQINEAGHIVRQSQVLTKFVALPEDQPSSVFEIFTFSRPSTLEPTTASAREFKNSLFLGASETHQFAIRGQFVDLSHRGLEGLCFIGVPWLWWMESNAPGVQLGISDFPIQDVQLDQLFFMSSQQTMVEDLQTVNDELQRAKAQVERNQEERQAYFNHISHEMRTPLNSVISSLSLLDDRQHDAQSAELLRLASQGAKRLLDIINFSLESAVVEGDGQQVSEEIFDLDVLITENLELLAPRALEKGLKLSRRGLLCFPHWVLGKKRLLEHVLANLLGNAVKFTQSGKVTLSAKALNTSTDPESGASVVNVQFSVADDGPGIPADQQQKIFEPFQTGGQKLASDEQSTGLGLAIVSRYVTALGGKIAVSSSEGVGSVFTFTIPMGVAEKPSMREESQRAMTYREWGMRGRVMLVDDMPTNLMLNSKLLDRFGVDVITADSGEQVLADLRAAQVRPDLILLDLQLPGISGYETVEQIRQDPQLSDMPVIGLSAHNDKAAEQKALAAGMDAYLTKPIATEKLVPVLGQWLDVFARDDVEQEMTAVAQAANPADEQGSELETPVAAPEPVDAPGTMSEHTTSEPVFDPAVIDNLLRDIGAQGMTAALTSFLSESAKRWDSLRSAIEGSDQSVVVRESHTLGSACFTFGVMRAGTAMRDVERRAMAGEAIAMQEIDGIAPELAQGISALQSHVAAQPPR